MLIEPNVSPPKLCRTIALDIMIGLRFVCNTINYNTYHIMTTITRILTYLSILYTYYVLSIHPIMNYGYSTPLIAYPGRSTVIYKQEYDVTLHATE